MKISRFVNAVLYYKERGYKEADFPYYANIEAINVTMPKGNIALPHIGDTAYVGSAEQSFIDCILNDEAYEGSFMAFSPCHRDEQHLSSKTNLIFSKLELYSTEVPYIDILLDAKEFIIREYGILRDNIEKVKTKDGCDLMLNGVELGSYGMRTVNGFTYAYGTGITFPRWNILE